MVLNAYIDGSGKGDPTLLVLAGYTATAEAWFEFSKEWQSRPEIAGWFYRVIEEHDIKAAVSCVIHTDDLVRVNRSIKYPSYITKVHEIENPYYWGLKTITDVLAQHQNELGLTEPVDFIFDEELEKAKIPRAWELMKKASDPEVAQLMGGTPIYRDDKKVVMLQAADLYAWWILKWERAGLIGAVKDLPFLGAQRRIFPD